MEILSQLESVRSGLFPATQWSLVLDAREGSVGALEALGRLARAYWRPLYVFVRQRGLDHEDAADAVQGSLPIC